MNEANLFASLVGVLSVESLRQSWSPWQVDARARESWRRAAGVTASGESTGASPLAHLDTDGVKRLLELVPGVGPVAVGVLPPTGRDADMYSGCAVPQAQAGLYRELLDATAARLSVLDDKPEETAENTLRALWQAAAALPMSAERAAEASLPGLDDAAVARLRELLARRLSGTPLAHLTGRQRFMELELMASAAALVPRKETELLGHAALAVLRQVACSQGTATVVDVCTGAGNLALALASHEVKARIYGSDLSGEAVDLARKNGVMLELDGRVEFRQGDFLDPFADGQFDQKVDLLVCNPPYISTGKVGTLPGEIINHEPSLAFDGGPFGIRILQRLLSEAPRYLRPGGWLSFEVGLGQGPAIMERVRRSGVYTDGACVLDANGAVRAIVARLR